MEFPLRDDVGEGLEGCVDGAFEGGGDDEIDVGDVGEGLVEEAALFLAVGRELGVADLVVGDVEVVVALGVADEMDGWGHCRGFRSDWSYEGMMEDSEGVLTALTAVR